MNAKPCNCLDPFSHCDMTSGCMNAPHTTLPVPEADGVVTTGGVMKTSELTGPQLDYWVARAEGHYNHPAATFAYAQQYPIFSSIDGQVFRPSSNWAHGGPIIEREQIALIPMGGTWCAEWSVPTGGDDYEVGEVHGATMLEAAMRAYVMVKIGDEVPDENS